MIQSTKIKTCYLKSVKVLYWLHYEFTAVLFHRATVHKGMNHCEGKIKEHC